MLHVRNAIRPVQRGLTTSGRAGSRGRTAPRSRPAAPEEEGGTAGLSVFDRWESVVAVLEVREALRARRLARLEAQACEPVAADELVAAAGGRDEHEAARHRCGRVAGRAVETKLARGKRGGGHGKDDRAGAIRLRWPVVQETTRR